MGQVVRLDLGSGNKREEGWTSVDQPGNYSGQKPDVEADLRSLPFPDGYADCIRAIHVIEHFYAWEALAVMKEWARVLKPGGELAIECPDLEKIVALMNVPEIPPQYTYWGLYGDPRYKDPSMVHKWAYTRMSMAKLMTQAGLANIRPEPVQFHAPVRDLRMVGVKPPEEQRIVMPHE